jgi:hypothetical protein
MCPHATAESLPNGREEMVLVNEKPATNGAANGAANGLNAAKAKVPSHKTKNPYAPRYAEFLSNISNFNIIESTLRGELLSVKTLPVPSLRPLSQIKVFINQRENNSPMPFSIRRLRSRSPVLWMRLVLNISNLLLLLLRSSRGRIVKLFASLD